ncbi:MAG: class I SAM-dependent methyltransferase [Gammaproteobacteria bacterium]
MKEIEPVKPDIDAETVGDIKEFWTRNVNAEELMGRRVSDHERGNSAYFEDLEAQRYRSHKHLKPWIEGMKPGHSVLEVGCGIGMDSHTMAIHGLGVTGIDLTEVAVDTARRRFQQEALPGTFQQGDATVLDFADESFDYVYSFGVLHHTQNTEQSIREAYRVLKPGGEARIMLYNRHSLNEFVHRLTRIPFEDADELCPVVRRFTRAEVREMFSQFAEVEIHKDFVFGEGYGMVFKLTPAPLYRLLSRTLGWHLMIQARKA